VKDIFLSIRSLSQNCYSTIHDCHTELVSVSYGHLSIDAEMNSA